MFTVYEKENIEYDSELMCYSAKSVNVYAVRDDENGYPQFLVCEYGEWKYRSAKYYIDKI